METENTEIIQSEFPGRAELLPYYYFLKYAWFDEAIILHDSVFIQKPIKFKNANKFLWHFESHINDNTEKEIEVIKYLNNYGPLLDFYNDKEQWYGCFGVMSVISYEFLNSINQKYNFFELLQHITCRIERMCLERIFACTVWFEKKLIKEDCSYFGNIEKYCAWNFNEEYSIYHYKQDKELGNIDLSIVKLWTGR
jgi:hypothetical protein